MGVKNSMQMMRDNPEMMKTMGRMMENMTPEQLMAQSRAAQQQMENMTPDQMKQAASGFSNASRDQVENAVKMMTQSSSAEETDAIETSEIAAKGSAMDPEVISKFFDVAELMSQPPSGGVTFAAFSSLPVITLLSGEREIDLSK